LLSDRLEPCSIQRTAVIAPVGKQAKRPFSA
jgi:hypothetical protein